jgi:hypothetical protein
MNRRRAGDIVANRRVLLSYHTCFHKQITATCGSLIRCANAYYKKPKRPRICVPERFSLDVVYG